jgi:hypothetical protein
MRKVIGLIAVGLLFTACSDQRGPTGPARAPSGAPSFTQVAHAAFTSIDVTIDGDTHCATGNGNVNCNIYDGKQFVWINGGPLAASLNDGTYFFAVLSPSAQNSEVNDGTGVAVDKGTPHNLSDDVDSYTNRSFSVSSGAITNLGGHVYDPIENKINLADYSTTLNPGGVYILAICQIADPDHSNLYPVDPSSCKYDAFKVRTGGGGGGGGDPVASGLKYYDTNTNGVWDAGEPGIPGWLIDVTVGGTAITGSPFTTVAVPAGTFSLTLVNGTTYHFAERHAANFTSGVVTGFWTQTGNTTDQSIDFLNTTTLNADKTYDVAAVQDGVTTDLNFGNVCYENAGGLTIGFWSNKNGQNLETATDFAALTALNLRDAAGNNKDFTAALATNKTAYSNWLLAATATNMAYMLSAQLSATSLNVAHGFTNANVVVYNGLTVAQLLTYGNLLLANPIAGVPAFNGQNGAVTIAASALRTEQENVKTAFDKINNNGGLGSFLQAPGVCPISFAP